MLSKAASSHRTYVEKILKYYEENSIRPGDPQKGIWQQAHYPRPKCLGGQTVVLLLREHHAVQGVLQSEEYQHRCFYGWEQHYVPDELMPIIEKWWRITGETNGKTTWARHQGQGTLSVRWEESAQPCVAINHNTGQVIEFKTAMAAHKEVPFANNLLNYGWRESGGWMMRHLDDWNALSKEEQEEQIKEAHDWANDTATQRRRNGRPTFIYNEAGKKTFYPSVAKACKTLGLTGSHLRRTLHLNEKGGYRYHKGYRMEYCDEH